MKNNNKKTALLAIMLTLTIAVGITVAYIVNSTESVENKFTLTAGDDLSGKIDEDWDENDGKDILPGAEITKKVRLENTSSADLAAEKAVIYGGLQIWWDKIDAAGNATPMTDAEYDKLEEVVSYIKFNNTDWIPIKDTPKNGSIYMYSKVIPRGEKTVELFEGVKISEDLTAEQAEEILAFAPGGFNIRIEGAIVQGVGIDSSEASKALLDKFASMATP